MAASHTLSTLQRHITDSRVLLQHRSRAAQAGVAEALQLEHGMRGPGTVAGAFAAEHIEPQLRLLGAVSEALRALSQALEAAAGHAQEAEERLAQARLACGDLPQAEGGRARLRARQLAVLAGDRADHAQAACRRLGSALLELGVPPA